MDAYCQRQGLSANNVRFLFDGDRLHETQTPKELNMENGDEIDVLVEQVGGSRQWFYVSICNFHKRCFVALNFDGLILGFKIGLFNSVTGLCIFIHLLIDKHININFS